MTAPRTPRNRLHLKIATVSALAWPAAMASNTFFKGFTNDVHIYNRVVKVIETL